MKSILLNLDNIERRDKSDIWESRLYMCVCQTCKEHRYHSIHPWVRILQGPTMCKYIERKEREKRREKRRVERVPVLWLLDHSYGPIPIYCTLCVCVRQRRCQSFCITDQIKREGERKGGRMRMRGGERKDVKEKKKVD